MAKILIVEDEDGTRWGISKMIELMGHTAIGCSNGRRALETITDNQDIALVITDVQMPEMDGRELVQRLRSSDESCKIPIIIFSGVVGPKEISDILKLGATAFLPKPVKALDIQTYIRRYIPE